MVVHGGILMSDSEISTLLKPVLERLEGKDLNQKLAHLLINELKRYLEECEHEILGFEIKYGFNYNEFQEKLEKGELGNPFSYELEQDSMHWEDLLNEKKHWLSQLKTVEEILK
jgi:hypothetical protein